MIDTLPLIFQVNNAMDALTREGPGLNTDDLGSPDTAALTSFSAFAVGVLIPLLPLLYAKLSSPISATIVLSALSLFAIGVMIGLFIGKSAAYGGIRMLLIGACASALSYSAGPLLSVTLF